MQLICRRDTAHVRVSVQRRVTVHSTADSEEWTCFLVVRLRTVCERTLVPLLLMVSWFVRRVTCSGWLVVASCTGLPAHPLNPRAGFSAHIPEWPQVADPPSCDMNRRREVCTRSSHGRNHMITGVQARGTWRGLQEAGTTCSGRDSWRVRVRNPESSRTDWTGVPSSTKGVWTRGTNMNKIYVPRPTACALADGLWSYGQKSIDSAFPSQSTFISEQSRLLMATVALVPTKSR